MQKKNNFFYAFLVFFLVSTLFFGFGKLGFLDEISSYTAKVFSPVRILTSRGFSGIGGFWESSQTAQLKKENVKLANQLVEQQKLSDQNKALMDQFQVVNPKSLDLIPANVVGMPSFIPGVSSAENLILDKGKNEGVKIGDAVVLKDNLVGRIIETSSFFSKVDLLTNSSSSFTAKTQQKALGVVKGQGSGEVILDNVLLSENLKPGDLVLTNGDENVKGIGYPPDLIVGKIISVDKNPSALFQKADIKTLIDINRLSTVFILVNN